MKIRVLVALAMLHIGFSGQVRAQEEGPYLVIEQVSERILATLKESRDLISSDPQAFYAEVDKAVAPAVDFERMAYLVMGQKYYAASSAEQRERWIGVFRDSLVETYARGLIGVQDASFTIDPPKGDISSATSVDVTQSLKGGGESVSVIYAMRRGSDGKWLLNNVIIEGINLGRTFRNQFAQLAARYSEDLNQVIANWAPEDIENG